jgi:hypothetical protein
MLPATTQRVSAYTSEVVNRRILRDTRWRVDWFERHPQFIAQRLSELDEEWDIERILETNASGLIILGSLLALTQSSRRWALLPLGVSAFLLQHALQGWCPPLPILRRLGFRTESEINVERVALKALRGDFGLLESGRDDRRASHALMAAQS